MNNTIKFSTEYQPKTMKFVQGIIEVDGKRIVSKTYKEHYKKFAEITGQSCDYEILDAGHWREVKTNLGKGIILGE